MKFTVQQIDAIINEASTAGRQAAEACIPPVMYVNGFQPVLDGPCGFAWINVKPAYGQVAKRLLERLMARKDSYYGGVTVWVSDYRQSMARKEAFAHAFAAVLVAHNVKAYSASRMD